jgi:hypothetical protein
MANEDDVISGERRKHDAVDPSLSDIINAPIRVKRRRFSMCVSTGFPKEGGEGAFPREGGDEEKSEGEESDDEESKESDDEESKESEDEESGGELRWRGRLDPDMAKFTEDKSSRAIEDMTPEELELVLRNRSSFIKCSCKKFCHHIQYYACGHCILDEFVF